MSTIMKSIFQEDWWMNITAKDSWGKVSYKSKFGDIEFVYALRKRHGLISEIYQPPLTPYSGIYFNLSKDVDSSTKYKLLDDAIPKLVKQLPKYLRLKINLLPDFDWWSPFYWLGFFQHTRYTSIINNISDHDSVWKGFNNNIRRNIKKAEKNLTVEQSYNAEALYTLFDKTMINQGRSPGYPKELLVELCQEIEKRKAGVILSGVDQNGVTHSAVLVVWDCHTAYYLVGGTDPSLRNSGAMPLTMWNAIKEASKHVDNYDFEGSMQKGIDHFVRSFGALPVPYYSISDGILANKIVRQQVSK